jgi:CheY-like chemotaxis protein
MSPPRREVFVIDDDLDILEAMTFVLEDAGYHVLTATNGAEALERLRAHVAPNLILLDLMMPIMNGWQFLAEQSSDPKLAGIPVVLVTGAGQASQRARSLGVAGYLEKPVDIGQLLSTTRRYCG